MAITSEVLEMSRAYRRDAGRLTDAQVAALVTAWASTWQEIQDSVEPALVTALTGIEGDFATSHALRQDVRLVRALEQAQDRISELVTVASATAVSAAVPDIVRLATQYNTETLRRQLPPAAMLQQAGLSGELVDQLGSDALDAIVSRTTQRIHSEAYLPLSREMIDAMDRNLVRGIAVGDNPRQAAQRMLSDLEGDFNGGLARATTIARTEMIDAGRVAKQSNAEANADLTEGWVWSCTLDNRTCMACLEMHGETFDSDVVGPEGHQNCRCDRIDKLKSWEELLGITVAEEPSDQVPDAKAWFENLTPESQREMMGPTRYEAWSSGRASWGDFSTRRDVPGWRPAYYQKPVRDL